MTSPIEIIQLVAYDGPNILSPSPGVMLLVRSDQHCGNRMRAAIKDAAQFIGLVLANLDVTAEANAGGVLMTATFDTAMPGIGAALCAYVVTGMNHEALGDEQWDRNAPLYTLQARRRREALPVAILQLMAEAYQRGLPTFMREDGSLQIGYGAKGWSIDPEQLAGSGGNPPPVPWDDLGVVTVIAVTGEEQRAATVSHLVNAYQSMAQQVVSHAAATFDEARRLLADPSAEVVILGLATGDLVRRGLPFDRCELAFITDRAGARPPEAVNDEAWVRALGLPMLLSPQPVRLNLTDPGLQSLVPYAPNGVLALG
ncbi:DUF4938 domain-containing protein [Candidatus Chloroploca sp. Khr17]|uniref:DUF4938 domain-containing protein n=1 Tax=Candidatus Chloroploca sp. Khr17 TaxID=2496869 RepID=UPI00101E05D1|nr:DUF4938 domain-containing protein [Candidatus Chloroploca sp. Khr17]